MWGPLALLAFSACAEPVVGGDDDEIWTEEEMGGAGGSWASHGVGSTDAASGSAGGVDAGASTGCGPDEHFCGGVCTGNTPGTGCAQSASCDPCPAPEHGTPTCTATGTCEFTCNDGFNDVGGACQCASQCCSSADCSGGNVCSSGTCQPPPCYLQDCFESCLLSLKCGGFCIGNTCVCNPCQ